MALEAERAFPEPDHLDELYRDHAARLRALIRRQVPRHLVDDTLHDTFLRVHASRHRFDPRPPVFPYLATLAYRACHETLRRERKHGTASSLTMMAGVVPDPHDQIEHDERARAVSRMVYRAWSDLLPRQRWLLYQRHVAGVQYAALSEQEGVGVEALRAAMCRARKAFAVRYRALVEQGGVFGGLGLARTRLRARLHRATVWAMSSTPWAEVPLIGFTAATAAVVAVVSVATVQPPSTTVTLIADTSVQASASFGNVPPTGRDREPRESHSSPRSSSAAEPAEPTVAAATVVIRAAGGAEIGPDGSDVMVAIVIDDPAGLDHHTEVPVYCNKGQVSTLLCGVARAAPVGE